MTRSIDVSSACCDGVILYWNRNRAGGRDASHGHSSVDLFQGQVETRTTMDNRHASHGRRGVLLFGRRRKKKKTLDIALHAALRRIVSRLLGITIGGRRLSGRQGFGGGSRGAGG